MIHSDSNYVIAKYLMIVRCKPYVVTVDAYIDHIMLIKPEYISHNEMWHHVNTMLLDPALKSKAASQ